MDESRVYNKWPLAKEGLPFVLLGCALVVVFSYLGILILSGFSVILTLFILLPGCAQQKHTAVTDETGALCPLPLPTVYTADIPCRDCPPTTASLTLRPDSLYFLRVTSTNPDTGAEEDVKAEIGVWKYVSVGNTILLATYDNVARVAPLEILSPVATSILATVPAAGDLTSISIFMASRTKRTSPSLTASPTLATTLKTVPGVAA